MHVRAKNPQRIFVSFSGMDGAGKSTQIQNLRARLTDAGLKVSLVTSKVIREWALPRHPSIAGTRMFAPAQ
jgi:adenylylsulfate kinase-like enzyme